MNLRLLTFLFAFTALQAASQIGLPPSSQNSKEDKGKANGYTNEQMERKNQETLERKNSAEKNATRPPQPRIPAKAAEQKSERKATTNFGEHPKLVVGITVDQMRMDYLYRYWDDFGSGGFKRLIQQGMVCGDHHFDYAPTYTGPGHASIYTGTTPRLHGIIANDWYDRNTGQSVYCAFDETVETVGLKDATLRDGKMSSHRMKSSTIGDEMKLATGMNAKVIAVSMKDRGATLPGGHLADGAYWFYGKDKGHFITSSKYTDELPAWVKKFNKYDHAARHLKSGWRTKRKEADYAQEWPDNNPFEKPFVGGKNAAFPYDLEALSEANGGYDILKSTPHGNTMVIDFAVQALEGESLGADGITDLLAISLSSTDYVGHQFGTNSWETMEIYLHLDRLLKQLFGQLDKAVGNGNWVCWLTSDHGAAIPPSLAQSEGMPVDYWKPGNMIEDINADLNEHYGMGDWVLNYSNDQFFFNRPLMRERGVDLDEAQRRIQLICQTYEGVTMAITGHDLTSGNTAGDPIVEKVRNGWSANASGDVMIVIDPGWIKYGLTGTTHGSPFPYDTHVPCIFYGWHIPSGITYERTNIKDIAPTIAALIHSPMPNACTGKPIQAVLNR